MNNCDGSRNLQSWCEEPVIFKNAKRLFNLEDSAYQLSD